MASTIFKIRWKKALLNCFIELGLDPDNNKYLIGISSEIENFNGSEEIRVSGSVKMYPREIYIRIWLLNYVFSIGSGEIELIRKKRKNIKFIIGLAGEYEKI